MNEYGLHSIVVLEKETLGVMEQMLIHNSTNVIADVKQIIELSREKTYSSDNALMIQSN